MKIFVLFILLALMAGKVIAQTGQWVRTTPTGCKAFTWREGKITIDWEGSCKDGLVDGYGYVTLYKDGIIEYSAEGNYVQGSLNGQGIINTVMGDSFSGDFKDGKTNGYGTNNYANGSRYVGEYKDGKYNGQGTYTFTDGRVWMGEWADDKANGRLIQYSANGILEKSGIYKDNVLVTSKYIDPTSFTRLGKNNAKPMQSEVARQDPERINAQLEQDRKRQAEEKKSYELERQRQVFVASNPRLRDVLTGAIRFDCVLACSFKFGYNRSQLKTYHDTKNWNLLAEKIQELKFQSDLSYFYLGKAAEGLGFYEAAQTYFNLALYENNKCNGLFNVCDGFNFPDDIHSRVAGIQKLMNKDPLKLEEKPYEVARQADKSSGSLFLEVIASAPDASGMTSITIQTHADTSSLKVNNDELGGRTDGNYTVKRIARIGQETKFVIAATDIYGNTDSKTISVVRQTVDSKVIFSPLNAANVKQQTAKDAVAIIIGIEKYKRVVKADYANADAQDFYDYAIRALGIKPENIKLLVDEGAGDVEILGALKNWLPLKVKKSNTDIYVFYSGHGLPSEDGKSLYLMPFSVDKNFIERTAINQQEIIASLQAVQPKSVTMFLDSCYSGQTRGGETLLASARPIALKVTDNAYPANFTVISASAPDQLSSSSPELKHGIFSYYLMKGMEGEADLNKDNKITVAEMQEYLTDMVGRQAMGMNRKQQPQLFGDPERVLVGK